MSFPLDGTTKKFTSDQSSHLGTNQLLSHLMLEKATNVSMARVEIFHLLKNMKS